MQHTYTQLERPRLRGRRERADLAGQAEELETPAERRPGRRRRQPAQPLAPATVDQPGAGHHRGRGADVDEAAGPGGRLTVGDRCRCPRYEGLGELLIVARLIGGMAELETVDGARLMLPWAWLSAAG